VLLAKQSHLKIQAAEFRVCTQVACGVARMAGGAVVAHAAGKLAGRNSDHRSVHPSLQVVCPVAQVAGGAALAHVAGGGHNDESPIGKCRWLAASLEWLAARWWRMPLAKPEDGMLITDPFILHCRWFAPSLKWLAARRWHMPLAELWAVRVALREVRQGVFGLQKMLATSGFDAEMMQASLLLLWRPALILQRMDANQSDGWMSP